METVEVVVKLPQNLYLDIKNGYASNIQREKVIEQIKNGIVLPKGHGGLIDMNALYKDFKKCTCKCDCSFITCPIYDQKIIIEADKAESEG